MLSTDIKEIEVTLNKIVESGCWSKDTMSHLSWYRSLISHNYHGTKARYFWAHCCIISKNYQKRGIISKKDIQWFKDAIENSNNLLEKMKKENWPVYPQIYHKDANPELIIKYNCSNCKYSKIVKIIEKYTDYKCTNKNHFEQPFITENQYCELWESKI